MGPLGTTQDTGMTPQKQIPGLADTTANGPAPADEARLPAVRPPSPEPAPPAPSGRRVRFWLVGIVLAGALGLGLYLQP